MNSNQKANYSDSYRLKSTQWYQIIVAYCVIRFFLSPIPLISYKKKKSTDAFIFQKIAQIWASL